MILIACEESGTVRRAFRARGFNAVSCDLLPARDGSPDHIQGDVREVLTQEFEMIIAFPPCTDLAISGAAHFAAKRADGRQQASIDFFMLFADHPCPKVAIENPVGIMSSLWRRPDQIIQPYQFGHAESKKTCLLLKGLPPLQPTRRATPENYRCKCGCRFAFSLGEYGCPNCGGDEGPAVFCWNNQTPSGQNRLGPSADRAQVRSTTYQGIAEAMAEQWTKEITP